MNAPLLRSDLRARRRSLLWRLHLWAAMIASPFILLACLTGLLYVLTPQIEAVAYRELDTVATTSAAAPRPLDDSVRAAERAAPAGWALHSVLPPPDPASSVRVVFMPPVNRDAHGRGDTHGGHGAAPPPTAAAPAFLRPNFGLPEKALVLYVDPFAAQVLGQLPESQRYSNWTRKLHSSLQQGDGWRWMIELGASWMMVMIVTGLFLWWPREGDRGVPRAGLRGRAAWRQWHAFAGIALSLLTLVMVATGLTWSKHAGSQVRWARDVTGQASPRIPALKSQLQGDAQRLNWDAAWQSIRSKAPPVPMQIIPPGGPEGIWRANALEKTGQPMKRFDLLLDAYSGTTLHFSAWADQTAFGKATAIGIPFHRGEFGLWNQALLVLFGLGVIFSLVSGWTMLIQRIRSGAAWWPKIAPGAWRSVSPWAWVGGLVMLAMMPLLALSAVPVALIDWFRHCGEAGRK